MFSAPYSLSKLVLRSSFVAIHSLVTVSFFLLHENDSESIVNSDGPSLQQD